MTADTDPLAARLSALTQALELGGPLLPAGAVAEAEALVERAGERLRLSTEHTVVALAGATGSGKSSLFNALAGMEIARVGVRRPTTDEAQACVWGPEGAGPLLAWLGIPRRHALSRESVLDGRSQEDLRGLVLLDLPDHDSTARAHRLEVDRLVGLVDLLVWVVDPQKYADAALHEDYLARLASHEQVMVVALNQADRLDGESLVACRADLDRLLREDGLTHPRVLVTSAVTGYGVAELRRLVARAVAGRAARVQRLQADVDRVAAPLLSAVDGAPGAVSRRDRARLAEALAAAAGVPGVVVAVQDAVRHRAVLATGWPVTRWVRRLRPDPLRRLGLDRRDTRGRSSLPQAPASARAQVDLAVREVADAAAGTLTTPWVSTVRAAARGAGGDLSDRLDRAVVGTDLGAERGSWWWAPAAALQWLLVTAAVLGLGWLALLAGAAYIRLPDPPTPQWRGFAVPTLLLVGGIAGGLLVAAVGRLLARVSAKARGARARGRLRAAVSTVAEEAVIAPVEAELARWRAVREHLVAAAGR